VMDPPMIFHKYLGLDELTEFIRQVRATLETQPSSGAHNPQEV